MLGRHASGPAWHQAGDATNPDLELPLVGSELLCPEDVLNALETDLARVQSAPSSLLTHSTRLAQRTAVPLPSGNVTRSSNALSALDQAIMNELEGLERLQAWTLEFTSGRGVAYAINCRVVKPPSCSHATPTALLLHGFGKDSSWLEWISYAPALCRAGMRVIAVDLPGFGKSTASLRVCTPVHWRPDGTEIVVTLLDAFSANGVSVLAHCGGAATFLRCLVASPERFRHRQHVIHNSVMALGPRPGLGMAVEQLLSSHHMRLYATWAEDSEHPCCCAAFKWLTEASERPDSFVRLAEVDFQSGLSVASVFGRVASSHFEATVRILASQTPDTSCVNTSVCSWSGEGSGVSVSASARASARARKKLMEQKMKARRDAAEIRRALGRGHRKQTSSFVNSYD